MNVGSGKYWWVNIEKEIKNVMNNKDNLELILKTFGKGIDSSLLKTEFKIKENKFSIAKGLNAPHFYDCNYKQVMEKYKEIESIFLKKSKNVSIKNLEIDDYFCLFGKETSKRKDNPTDQL